MDEAERLFDEGMRNIPAWNAPPDPDAKARGIALIERAAELGHHLAMRSMFDLAPDHAVKYRWAVALAQAGEGSRLCSLLTDHTFPLELRRQVRDAAERGEAWAELAIGALYAGGLSWGATSLGLPDGADAVAWMERAARRGHGPALYALATRSAPSDKPRALELAKAALASGEVREPENARQLAALAARLLEELGASAQELSAAREALANAGDPASMVWLGERLRAGDGVPRDVARARALFERAAALSHAAAHRELAKMYEAGDGVPVDDDKARELYEIAAETEADEYARDRLATKYGLSFYARKKPKKKAAKKARKKK